jgi:hypothetical protein
MKDLQSINAMDEKQIFRFEMERDRARDAAKVAFESARYQLERQLRELEISEKRFYESFDRVVSIEEKAQFEGEQVSAEDDALMKEQKEIAKSYLTQALGELQNFRAPALDFTEAAVRVSGVFMKMGK